MTMHSNRYIFIKDNVKILRYTYLSVTMKSKNRGNDIEIQVGFRLSASAYSTNVSKVKIRNIAFLLKTRDIFFYFGQDIIR
jgi:hypothetical protein